MQMKIKWSDIKIKMSKKNWEFEKDLTIYFTSHSLVLLRVGPIPESELLGVAE